MKSAKFYRIRLKVTMDEIENAIKNIETASKMQYENNKEICLGYSLEWLYEANNRIMKTIEEIEEVITTKNNQQ